MNFTLMIQASTDPTAVIGSSHTLLRGAEVVVQIDVLDSGSAP